MKLVPVECLPRKSQEHCKRKDVGILFEEFMASGALVARIDLEDGDYQTTRDCVHSLRNALYYQYDYPIEVRIRCGDAYLVRK